MQRINENIVKKVALRFLRSYYKNRLRDERFPIEAKYDLEAAGGIIADGYYSFTTAKGKRFVATFEATDFSNKDEVLFKPQWSLMLWDGMAVSSLVLLGLSLFNYVQGFQQLMPGNVLDRVGLIFLTLGLSLGCFVLVAKQFIRYRYIYAIEQFKKYFADEQWIALAEDVFEAPSDPYYKELKRQCILNGIGLLTVNSELEVKVLITPSRYDLFQGKRRPLSFNRTETKALTRQDADNWWSALRFRLPARPKEKKSIYRYRKTYTAQIAITFAALFLTSLVYLQEWKRAPLQRISKEKFRNEVAKSESGEVPEPDSYLADTIGEHRLATEDEWFLPAINNDTTSALSNDIDLSKYPCERYNNFNITQYIIEIGTMPAEDDAQDLANEYAQQGMDVTVLPWGCFGRAGGFVIFTGYLYGSAREAKIILDDLRSKHPVVSNNWRVRELTPAKLEHPG